VLNQNLQVRVVQLNGELDWVYGLWRWRDPPVLVDLVLRQGWMRPAWLGKHLAIEYLGVVCVEEGDGVRVLGIGGGRVDVVEGILGVKLRAILGEEERLVVLDLVRRRVEEES